MSGRSHHGMAYARYVARRLAVTAVTLLGLMTLVFIMIKTIPGDEARVIAGPEASPEQVEAIRQQFGLDAPLVIQYFRFVWRILHGDFGTSVSTLQPVLSDLAKVFPSTLELVILTMAFSLIIAVVAACLSASWRDSLFDGSSRVAAVIAGGMPAFWLALLLQYFLASSWRVFPISGQQSFQYFAEPITGMPLADTLLRGDPAGFADALSYIVLPALALAVFFAAQLYRTLRASLIGILQSDFIIPVRAKGASFPRILLRHALPNAMGPTITLAGVQLGMMIGSAVLVEGVFARQGVGAYLANAVAQKDTYAVLGTVLIIGGLVCLVNLAVDILQLVADPRVRTAQFEGAAA